VPPADPATLPLARLALSTDDGDDADAVTSSLQAALNALADGPPAAAEAALAALARGAAALAPSAWDPHAPAVAAAAARALAASPCPLARAAAAAALRDGALHQPACLPATLSLILPALATAAGVDDDARVRRGARDALDAVCGRAAPVPLASALASALAKADDTDLGTPAAAVAALRSGGAALAALPPAVALDAARRGGLLDAAARASRAAAPAVRHAAVAALAALWAGADAAGRASIQGRLGAGAVELVRLYAARGGGGG
jgi:hypothetical protein